MNRLPRVEYTQDARRDFDHCRHFLRRRSPDTAWRRMKAIVSAIRRIRENPEINAVRKIDPESGLHFRRYNVAQFVVVYVYVKPNAQEPEGLVSLRAFRHASEEDVFWEVRENTFTDGRDSKRRILSTGIHARCAPWETQGSRDTCEVLRQPRELSEPLTPPPQEAG